MNLRPPEKVMRLERMGQMFPTRLSFMRVLLRKLAEEAPTITRSLWRIDRDGFGEAVYTVHLNEGDVSLFAMTRPLEDEHRSDRVIATAWDAAFVLFDGVPDEADIRRLIDNAPFQEAGRFCEKDLVLSRANKSVRLFNSLVDKLRNGKEPDADQLIQTGYLMRTTAVYGNGKFGIADHARIAERPILGGAFMAEMLTVWLIRGFTLDLAEYLGGREIPRQIKRQLGVGNATGLGMAPYLVSHPQLVDGWIRARENALARVLDLPNDQVNFEAMERLCKRAIRHLDQWTVADSEAQGRIEKLRSYARNLADTMHRAPKDLLDAAPDVGAEEFLVALLIEAHPDQCADLESLVATARTIEFDPSMPLEDLRAAIHSDWDWAQSIDFESSRNTARFWYVSEEKLEPRIGARHEEPGAELESPLDIARRVAELARDLEGKSGNISEFLLTYPNHREAAYRVQARLANPYGEIHDNLIGESCRPIDMLRAKLAVFGAAKFDPKSDLWTRITLAQGSPLLDELHTELADDWWLAAR